MEKAKHIVVITGSPRRSGNSFAMTRAFTDACEAKGHSVTRFDAAFMNVRGCMACEHCYEKGDHACIFNDDFNTIARAVETADLVVLACPVYWYSFPAQIKAVLDKFFSFYMRGKRSDIMKSKKCALLSCLEETDMEIGNESVRTPYLRATELLGWNSIGEVIVPGVYEAGAIKSTDGEERAARLAELI